MCCVIWPRAVGLQKRKGEWSGSGRGARDPTLPLQAERGTGACAEHGHPLGREGGGPEHTTARELLPECSGLWSPSWLLEALALWGRQSKGNWKWG